MKTSQSLAGSVRRFGSDGILYEVLRELDESSALIKVLETGEETRYPIAAIRSDPAD